MYTMVIEAPTPVNGFFRRAAERFHIVRAKL